jgi:Fe-S cluster biogenesis protein NfuA
MTTTLERPPIKDQLARLDALLQQAEQAFDPASKTRLQEIVRAILGLHGEGLQRMLNIQAETGTPGQTLLDAWTHDEVVSGLLLLHGLHPMSLENRVQEALESVRPYLQSHGGDVELLDLSESHVRLRLEGNCHGCASSAATMQHSVEEAIYARAPEIAEIEVEGLSPAEGTPEPNATRMALPLV